MDQIVANVIENVGRLPQIPRYTVFLSLILVYLLWQGLDMIDFIISEWVSRALRSPESQLGVGLGGAISAAVGIKSDWPWNVVCVGIIVGALLGGCICSGIYKLLFRRR